MPLALPMAEPGEPCAMFTLSNNELGGEGIRFDAASPS
jgi:hypothetical protein